MYHMWCILSNLQRQVCGEQPRTLHRDLVEMAAQEGVSLNQYISTALAQVIGGAFAAGRAARRGMTALHEETAACSA